MGGGYTITIPQDVPTSSIERDGETLYFQGWMKNGVVSTIYTPNETVEDVNITDVFTPYYAKDADYPELTFTVDGVTGEYILTGANKNITSVTIPALYQGQKVCVVNNRAFYQYYSLQTVKIPQTITKIGDYAFDNCSKLTEITIPNSVTSIGYCAFYYCTSLTSINIPDSVTTIGESAFSICSKLTSVTIGNGVTSIGDRAFYYCSKLTSVTIGSGVTSIGNNAFCSCSNLTSINVDSGNQNYCAIDGVLFNKGLTSIICYPLAKADATFSLPDSVTYIGDGLFMNNTNLSAFIVGSNNTKFSSIDGVLFNKDATSLIRYPAGKTGEDYSIPSSVKQIRKGAFCRSSLKSITIPNGVTGIYVYAFQSCTNLTSITIPDSVTYMEDGVFQYCYNLESVTMGNGIRGVMSYMFNGCSKLTSIAFGNNLSYLANSAFYQCSSLTDITIPESVTTISTYTFIYCHNLSSVTFENTTGWYATDSSSYSGGEEIDVTNPTTNATNLKSNSSWCTKYLYRK